MSILFKWNPEDFNSLVKSCKYDMSTPYILKYMSKTGKILEAGCGLARYDEFLSKRGFDIVGIELSQDTVDTVKKLAPLLNVRQGDILELPFEDNAISRIMSLGVVEHFIEGPKKPLTEMFRILKPGHYAVITVPSFNYIRRIKHTRGIYHINPVRILKESKTVRRIFRKEPIKTMIPYKCKTQAVSDIFFEYMFTKEEFEKELEQVGFTIVENVPIALMDGIYHEFGRAFVCFKDWKFYPNFFGRLLNRLLSLIPWFHNHMHLCVVRK